MKKIAAAVLASLALTGASFAEPSVSFSNKLYEEDYFYASNDGESEKDFPTLKNEASLEFTSDRIDASVTAVVGLDDFNDRHFGIDGYIDDWKIEWRVINPLALGLHDNIYSEGSALPIYDDNLENGNIGSDGFTLVVHPEVLDGKFRFGATVPFNFTKDEDFFGRDSNWLKGKNEDDDDKYLNFGLGAIYADDLFEVGLTVKDVADSDSRLIGGTLSFPNLFGAVDGLTIGGGYTKAEGKDAGFGDLISVLGADFGVECGDLINANVTFENDLLSIAAEALFSLKDDESDYDLYSACNVGFSAAENLLLVVGGKVMADFNGDSKDENKNIYSVLCGAEYEINEHHSVGIEFDFFTRDETKAFAVPVFWKWTM